jgi:hypothetical protein
MSDTFDTYGIDSPTLEDAKLLVESKLGVALGRHDSDAWGGEYFSADLSPGTARLIRNWNSLEQVWNAPDWPQFSVVLQISRSAVPDEIRATLTSSPDVGHLRREVVPSRGSKP